VISSKATDGQRAESMALEATETLLAALASLRQYVVETDPSVVEQFRLWADTLIAMVQECRDDPNVRSYDEVRTSLRGGLRDYRDRAERYINELRDRLATTTVAIKGVVGTLQAGDSPGEAQIKEQLVRLGSIKESRSLEQMRAGVTQAAMSLAGSMAQLKQEKDAVIAQLSSEIQALQSSLDKARRAAKMEVITELCGRQEFEELVKEEILSGNSISAIRLTLQNFPILTTWYQQNVMDQLLSAFCKRARGVLPEDAVLGRWRENLFYVLLHSTDTRTILAGLVQKCRGNYVCMDGVYARTLYLQLAARTLNFPQGLGVPAIIQKLNNSRAA